MTSVLNWVTDEVKQGWGTELNEPSYVLRDDRICGGKAVVTGTRIPVFMLVDLYDDGTVTAEYVVQQYPRLTLESFFGALSYANKFRRQIDEDRRDNEYWSELLE